MQYFYYAPVKRIRLGFVQTSDFELKELAKAWVAISLAFAIVMVGFSLTQQFLSAIVISAFTVGIGFLLHELAHKLVAQRYGAWAEFRAFDQMLLFAVIMSFLGFVFAAPGAVFIHGRLDRRKNGIVSVAGPLTNLALALLFLLAGSLFPFFPQALIHYGFLINAWLGVFNMIPFGNFDGRKVLDWSKTAYGVAVAAGLVLLFVSHML
jgi:Zn-dependent protease